MKLHAILLAAAIATAVPPAMAQSDIPVPPDIGTRIAEGFAVPAAAAFAEDTASLAGAVEELCAAPGAEALAAARRGFAETLTAWGRLSVLRFGPLTAENRFETVFFWPDPRGVTLRQVQELLAAEDPSATDPGALAGKSVAVRGLPALEFLLYGAGAEDLATPAGDYRCRYAAAVSAGLSATAADVLVAWRPGSPFHAAFTAPTEDAPLYRTPEEVAGELLRALATTLQFVAAAELDPALGENLAEARGRRTPFWRSDLTFALIDAQLAGLEDLLDAAMLEARLEGELGIPLANLRSDLVQTRGALAGVEAPAEFAFGDDVDRPRLDYALLLLEFANENVGTGLAGALGLAMGFNALDGD